MTEHAAQAQTLFFEGNRRMAAGDAAGAAECFRQALTLAPDLAEAWANLGWLQERAGAAAEAEASYRRALSIEPGCAPAWRNLGALLLDAKRFDESEAAYRQALEAAPESPAAWSDLGVLLACAHREAEAEQCQRTALALDGSYSRASFNLSYLLLRQGRFEEGWLRLEARDWYASMARHFDCPRWQGEPLAGRSLVIAPEAGHGDMIQFCRYAVVLKTMGAARISVICHPGLVELFRSLSGADEVLSMQGEVPRSGWDFWSPPLSLPHYCHTGANDIPAPVPYLAADPARMAKWQPRLPDCGLRVGLVWKGNPDFENDRDRSLPALDVLAPLGGVAGIRCISLQKGRGEDEARHPPAGLQLLALGDELQDFADTAAVVANLDLVISVDTAVAHLAGALGKPCWVLLPHYRTDWRWLTGRTDSPWYPHLRLFRQPPQGGWPPVVAAVVQALGELLV